MFVPEIKGLKYPDEFVTKFFFKNELHKHPGRVMEIGPSNGNNLLLFYEYGWDVEGVDISAEAVTNANHNFEKSKTANGLSNTFSFHQMDMLDYVKNYEGEPFDVILLPGSFYYTDVFEINKMFECYAKKSMIKEDGLLMLRFRSPEDYRFGKGEKMGPRTYKFDFDETNEEGCINTFFTKDELTNLIGQYMQLTNVVSCNLSFENPQRGHLINNVDIIVWGNIKPL